MNAAEHAGPSSSEHLRRLTAENVWLRAALEAARDEARLVREALRIGSRQC
ncbi:MAG: hypothetical protein ABIQ81_01405 [Novosphingobium sp.]